MKLSMEDGKIVDTDKAIEQWNEEADWNGSNNISSKGNYYIVLRSQWQGEMPSARWTTQEEAARWLLLNDHTLPDDLVRFEEQVTE